MSYDNLEKISALGQVWTPDHIANNMAKECYSLNKNAVSVLDPSCGPGTFSHALNHANFSNINLVCYDIDPRMASLTSNVNHNLSISGDVREKDYLSDITLKDSFDLVIMNPPYIRQENIPLQKKKEYHDYLSDYFGVNIDKKANLFSLFLLKGLIDLATGGILCAIVYDAVTQTSYGKKILNLMCKHATLLSHTKIKMPFDNVLVDASILYFQKKKSPFIDICVENESDNENVPLHELLDTRRGTGFPLRKIFIAEKKDPYFKQAKPFFIKQSTLDSLLIKPDNYAYIVEDEQAINPQLLAWMKKKAISLGSHVQRFSIKGVHGEIAFNYYLRNKVRHLWNVNNVAVSDNFYISKVKNNFPQEAAWLLLNSDIYLNQLLSSARNQGNGLLKLQLFEYKNTRVPNWNNLSDKNITQLFEAAISLIEGRADYDLVRKVANELSKGMFDV